jgi:hypothetical protein
MKSWHILVLNGCKTVAEREIFDIKAANALYEEWKEKYNALNLEEEAKVRGTAGKPVIYAVKREWY